MGAAKRFVGNAIRERRRAKYCSGIGRELFNPESLNFSVVNKEVDRIPSKALTFARLNSAAGLLAGSMETLEVRKGLDHERFVSEVFFPVRG